MYKRLDPSGDNPRVISEVVNNLVEGKSNNTGTITLNVGGATTTTINNERIGYNSVILLEPITNNAAHAGISYGGFHDTTTQTASANTPKAITFNSTDYSNNVYVGSPTSRIYFNQAGDYQVSFSIQGSNTDTASDNVTVWFRINGADVATSAGISAIPSKHGSISGALVFGWSAFYTFNAGDYLEMYWTTDAGTSSLATYAAGTSPVHPLSPSVAVNINQISDGFNNVYISSTGSKTATITHFKNTLSDMTYRYIIVA